MKARLNTVGNSMMAFSTPIHRKQYEDNDNFNTGLAERILTLRGKSEGLKRSNYGGWHSDETLLTKLGHPFREQLSTLFVENVRAAIESVVDRAAWPDRINIDAWANVNEMGDSNSAHLHPGCIWSGVYYVSTEEGSGGEIVFIDPRTASLMTPHPLNPFLPVSQLEILPKAGMMLTFPSFIYHSVRPYRGSSPRISIAFNLR